MKNSINWSLYYKIVSFYQSIYCFNLSIDRAKKLSNEEIDEINRLLSKTVEYVDRLGILFNLEE